MLNDRMKRRGGARAEEFRDELHHVGELAREAAQEQWEHLRSRGMERARELEDRVADQPLKSLAIAVGVGFVLGLMWKRH